MVISELWTHNVFFLERELLAQIIIISQKPVPYNSLCSHLKQNIKNAGIIIKYKGKNRNVNSFIRHKYGGISEFIYKFKEKINIENIVKIPPEKNNTINISLENDKINENEYVIVGRNEYL